MADYPTIIALSALDASLPADTETVNKLPAADRQLRDFLKTYLAVSLDDTGALKSGAAGTTGLADGSVTLAKLAANSVDDTKIADSSITNAKIVNAAVDGPKLANGAIASAHFGAGAVDSNALGASAVTTAKLVANSADASIVKQDGAVDANRAITTNHIRDAAVTEAKVATKAVPVAKMKSAGVDAKVLVTKADGTVIEATVGGSLAATLNGSILELNTPVAGDTTTYVLLRVRPGSGSNGGASVACTSGNWTTKNVRGNWSEISDGGSLVSVSGTQITFAVAGTYIVKAWASAYSAGAHKIKLRNTTAGTDLVIGSPAHAPSGIMSKSEIAGSFAVAASDIVELWHWTEKAVTGTGLGIPCNTGDDEQYAAIELIKVA